MQQPVRCESLAVTVPPDPTLIKAFWMQNLYGNIVLLLDLEQIDVSPQCSSMVQSCLVPLSD